MLDAETEDKIRLAIEDTIQRANLVAKLEGEALSAEQKEGAIVQILSTARSRVEGLVMSMLGDSNGLRTAVITGAKGKPANVAQICAAVLQQMFNGARLKPEFFYSGELSDECPHGAFRTLLTQPANDMSPESRGFIRSSFAHGMNFLENLLHQAASRIGLADTAVKTAKIGYMLRKFRSAMMSNSSGHDGATRNAESRIIELAYGDDCFDGKDLVYVAVPAIKMMLEDLERHVGARKPRGAAFEATCAAKQLLLKPRVLEADPSQGDDAVSCMVLVPFHAQRMLGAAAQTDADDELATEEDLERELCRFAHETRSVHEGRLGRRFERPIRTYEDMKASFQNLDDPSKGARAYACLCFTPRAVIREHRLTKQQLKQLVDRITYKHGRSLIDAGEAVGSVSAMSVSEPITQLTLNTFHSSGMAVTQVVSGLQAMTDLTNADDKKEKADRMAQTSQGTIRFLEPFCRSEAYAKLVAQSLQRVSLQGVAKLSHTAHSRMADEPRSLADRIERMASLGPEYSAFAADPKSKALSKSLESLVTQVRTFEKKTVGFVSLEHRLADYCIEFVLRRGALDDFGLDVSHVEDAIRNYLRSDALVTSSGMTSANWVIRCRLRGIAALAAAEMMSDKPSAEALAAHIDITERRVSEMVRVHLLEHVIVHGHPIVAYATAKKRPRFHDDGSIGQEYVVETIGSDLLDFCSFDGVDSSRTEVTSVIDVQQRLGIEAASAMLARRFKAIFDSARVDHRHVLHLVRVMTHVGAITPLTRDKMSSLGAGVLGRAAFEMTTPWLHSSAAASAIDPIKCVPSNVILGRMSDQIGTGSVRTFVDPAYAKIIQDQKSTEAAVADESCVEVLAPMEMSDSDDEDEETAPMKFVGFQLPKELVGTSKTRGGAVLAGEFLELSPIDEEEESDDEGAVLGPMELDKIEAEASAVSKRVGPPVVFEPPEIHSASDVPSGLLRAVIEV